MAEVSDLVRGIGDVDRMIHEPVQLAIVMILSTVESADFIYLKNQTGLTRGNLSSYLYRFKEAGYVDIEKTCRGKIPLTLY